MALLTIRKGEHPATQSNPTLLRILSVSYLFAPEKGLLFKLAGNFGYKQKPGLKANLSLMLRIFAYSILIFGALGIAQVVYPSLQVVGIPQVQVQQITPTTDVLFTTFVPSWSETMAILFILFTLLGLVAYLLAKYVKDKNLALILFFTIAIIPVSLLIALSWGGLHTIVYGNSDAEFLATLIFGYIGSVMTIITGTFIPFFIWHVMNNLFAKLSELVTMNEDIIFIAGITWVIFFITVMTLELKAFAKKMRSE